MATPLYLSEKSRNLSKMRFKFNWKEKVSLFGLFLFPAVLRALIGSLLIVFPGLGWIFIFIGLISQILSEISKISLIF